MGDPHLPRGATALRAAPWGALAGANGLAAALLSIPILTPHSSAASPMTLLGVAACGAVGGFLLDEESGDVADATPTSRPQRTRWRLTGAALPVGVAAAGLGLLAHVDSSVPWLRLLPLAVGATTFGACLAAVLRRRGASAPGDLAAVVVVCVTLLAVTVDPLHRWVSLAPLGEGASLTRSLVLWSALVAACLVVLAASSTDPGRRTRRRRPRPSISHAPHHRATR